ncbi:hypothetical protein BJF79_31135 [Actinomadura sp. CNU-125]|uniref:hypothetical protein n=1 Tax=Actinomadura sp. CNU-125 TaxID=1904961 RepID=UPI00096460A2|nr:hypothetical protein [Actinomadura sp. CNU-125]OLT36508.1 hypothetical protein BJF79_31135 [Actinomadura sp. CNU-125]
MDEPDTSRRTGAGRRGPWAAWTAGRLFANAARGDAGARDAVVRIAGTPGHRLRDRAKRTVATLWAETLDPALRRVVLDTGAVAARGPARLPTLALHDRLDEWGPADAGRAPSLLAHSDPDVRDRAAAACRTATGAMLRALWTSDGTPGPPLLDVLLDNPEPPPGPVLDALWSEWLDDPAESLPESLPEFLRRWGRPAGDPRHGPLSVIALASDANELGASRHRAELRHVLRLTGHPLAIGTARRLAALAAPELLNEIYDAAAENPGLARFCVGHGVVPADPPRRALFYLRTGHLEQRRALDPDGSLLALGYAAATGAERAQAREAMLGAGELDLVRVIVGGRAPLPTGTGTASRRGSRIGEVSAEEIRYLAERLADRREWDELWTFVRDFPVTTCVDLVRLFDGWAPREDADRALFSRLRRFPLQKAESGMARIRDRAPATVLHTGSVLVGRSIDLSFAPDGPFLAVGGDKAGVCDLRTSRVVEKYEFAGPVDRVLHLGDGTLLAAEHAPAGPHRLMHCSRGRDVRELAATSGALTSLVATGPDGRFAAGVLGGELLLGDPAGAEARPLSGYGFGACRTPKAIAHRASGRLAVFSPLYRRYLLIETATGNFTLGDAGDLFLAAEFIDADTVAYMAFGRTTRVSLPEWTVRSELPDPPGYLSADPCALPRTGHLVVADWHLNRLRACDDERTSDFTEHRPADTAPTARLAVSPDGTLLAVGRAGGEIDLYHLPLWEASGLLRRPLAEFVPGDLELVDEARAGPVIDPHVRAVLDLVRACLHHRFRFDIEVDGIVRPAVGDDDDISL